jgi:hypothetical protein
VYVCSVSESFVSVGVRKGGKALIQIVETWRLIPGSAIHCLVRNHEVRYRL